MSIIGITGIIGSGKSTVCALLRKQGFAVINADRVGHQLLKNSKVTRQKLMAKFGTTQRRKIAEQVFADKKKLSMLNKIMHPAMKKEIIRKIRLLRKSGQKNIAVEAAVLYEMQLKDIVDKIWFVAASKQAIVKRFSKAKLAKKELIKRLKNTTSVKKVLKITDEIIYNNGAVKELAEKIAALLKN